MLTKSGLTSLQLCAYHHFRDASHQHLLGQSGPGSVSDHCQSLHHWSRLDYLFMVLLGVRGTSRECACLSIALST